jgi:hypothetical protein
LTEPLTEALDRIGEIAARRRDRAARWRSSLHRLGDALVDPGLDQPLPWRVIRRVPERRQVIVSALRSAGFDAGTNYPPLTDEFPIELGSFSDADAAEWGAQVVNLWVTDDYDDDRIEAAIDVMARALEQAH